MSQGRGGTRRTARALLAALGLVILATPPAGAAAPAPDAPLDEATASPYLIDASPRDLAERTARHLALAEAARAGGDRPRQARHLVLACTWGSMAVFDPTMSSPACLEARRLAASPPLPDVPLMLEAVQANLAFWVGDTATAVRLLEGVAARGAGVDASAPEARPLRLARLLQGIGLTETGRYGEAGAVFDWVREASRRGGDLEQLAYADLWACWNDIIRGDLAEADAACGRARALVGRTGDFFAELNLAYVEGSLRADHGDLEGALAGYRRTLALSARPGGGVRAPTARSSIANTLVRLRRYDEARVALLAIDRDRAAGRYPPGLAPLVEHAWGMLERNTGHHAEAARHFAVSARSQEHFVSIWGARGLAGARQKLGDLAGARAALEEAVARIEAERSSLGGAASRASYAEIHADVYRELVGVRWDAEGAAAATTALELAEAGKARALLDALAAADGIGQAAPTLGAAAVMAGLRPDEVLVEYVSADDRLFAVTVTRERVALAPLPGAGTQAALAARVSYFAALVQEGDEAALGPAAGRLAEDLLTPALAGLGPEVRTLIVAPDGPLHHLPFDALGVSPRVIDRWDVVLVPSASALAAHTPSAGRRAAALVVAASAGAGALAPLPGAPAEAAAIRRELGGEVAELVGPDATLSRLKATGLDRFAVVHFASHARVDARQPLHSSLQLAPEAGRQDGRWRAEDIYRTRLANELVVLSACSTAGGAIADGEGVMSLARAFLHAGAGATLATLWDLPDAPGPAFAEVFYGELAAGKPLGAAAATARRELRRRGAPPRAWAAWVLAGAPGQRVAVEAPSGWSGRGLRRSLGLALAAALAGAAALLWWRARRARTRAR